MSRLLLLALLLPAAAFAEPLALRQPMPGPNLVVALGGPESGAATWLGEHVGLGVGMRAPFASVDVAAALRTRLVGKPVGWGIDVGAAAGVVVPLTTAGVGLEIAPWWQLGWTSQRFVLRAGAAVPVAAGWADGFAVRVPFLAEMQAAARLDVFAKEPGDMRWWVGGHAGLGGVAVSDGKLGIEAQLAVWLGWQL